MDHSQPREHLPANGQLSGALADFDRAIEIDDSDAWAIGRRGETYQLMGHYPAALADFDRALDLEPDDDWWSYNRALTHLAMSSTEQAKTDLSRAIRRAENVHSQNPEDSRNVFDLALYHLAAGQADQARRLYQTTVSDVGVSPWLVRGALQDLDDILGVLPDLSEADAIRTLLQKKLKELS